MSRRTDFIMEDNNEESVCLNGTRKIKNLTNNVQLAWILVWLVLIAALLGLYGYVYVTDSSLPSPLSISDEEAHPDAFIAERARYDLKNITDLGPRVVGSDVNEVLTVNLLTSKLNNIIKNAHKNQKLEIDIQVVSGSHFLNRTPHGVIMSYSNLKNIIVKLHALRNVSESLLVNAHFDSVPTSPGASDDAINCAVMLEILRKLSKLPQRPLHNIVFLFNGAEEPGLVASHGFITKHKWAKGCKVVLNLEAAGIGGKIILFQTGPSAPWLMKYYRKVPHPYGQAAGEEIFQSNLVPSDTDFRIFRDYGGLVGLDMAFFKNGYVYHTKFDNFDYIPAGSFQHVGDNALSLVKNLANASELANPKENPGKVVFFDFLGIFMITYSQTAANIINSVVILLSITVFVSSLNSLKLGSTGDIMQYVTLICLAIIGGWVIAVIFVVLVSLFLDKIWYSMSWYANPWLVFGLYAVPTVIFSFIFLPKVNTQNIAFDIKSQVQAHCVRIILTVILLIGTIFNIRAMYALLVPVLFNTLAFLLIFLFTLRLKNKKTKIPQWRQNCQKLLPISLWQVIYVACLIIPTIFLMYAKLTTLSLFVPLTGRFGSDKISDLLVGIISLSFTILITSPFVALATHRENIRFIRRLLGVVFVVSFVIVFTPLGFPYTGNKNSPAPQRYWIIHTDRIIHHKYKPEVVQDSGYFVLNMDRNSPDWVKSYVKELSKAKSMKEDCKNYLLCGVPIVHSKMVEILKYSTWIPAEKPTIPIPTTLQVISKTRVSPKLLRYNVSVTGPDRIALYLSPEENLQITNISLLGEVSRREVTAMWNKRELFYIFHIYSKNAAPLNFTFDVRIPAVPVKRVTEVAICGIHVHNVAKTAEYSTFLEEFPDWTDVTAWVGTFKSEWI